MSHAKPQGSLMYVMTLTTNRGQCTVSGTYNPAASETRFDAYGAIRRHALNLYPHMEDAVVAFFSLEPNTF
ncbi:hypothetical protein ACFT0G_12140 [Streptomyces sp. NPDC057020]|uniref:hypothetical protein n=1 Tax=unclassified Streptomyces TaxID=2593676 RepID=UPI00362E95CA